MVNRVPNRRRRKRPKLDREEVFQALTKLGHEPSYIELDGRDATLFALAKSKVDLVFNLAESYAGDDSKDMNIPAFMDLVGVHYTGSGPHGLLLAQDKALSGVRAKAMTQRPITVGSELTPTVLQMVNLVVVPLAFILFGLVRWRIRTARRARAKL